MNIGALEMNRMSLDQLDKTIEHLTSAKIFYDAAYENEREIIDAINIKVRYMSEISDQLHEKESEFAFRKYFIGPYREGKFAKILLKYPLGKNADESAYQCVKKLGRKAEKINISEYALIQRIKHFFQETKN